MTAVVVVHKRCREAHLHTEAVWVFSCVHVYICMSVLCCKTVQISIFVSHLHFACSDALHAENTLILSGIDETDDLNKQGLVFDLRLFIKRGINVSHIGLQPNSSGRSIISAVIHIVSMFDAFSGTEPGSC